MCSLKMRRQSRPMNAAHPAEHMGTVAKLSQLLHHVYSLQIHGYGFDCVCLKMVHTPTWQFVYWKIGDYPLSAVFFGRGTCFSDKPICCHQKTEVS